MYDALFSGYEFEIDDMRNKDKEGEIYEMDQQIIPISIHGEEPDYFAAIAVLE